MFEYLTLEAELAKAETRAKALEADRDQISLALAVAKADRDKWFNRARDLEKALTLLYDKWENGDDCYEDPERFGGFLGKAFKLNEAEENQVLALIGSTPETDCDQAVPDGWCPVCGGQNGEHKSGCQDGSEIL